MNTRIEYWVCVHSLHCIGSGTGCTENTVGSKSLIPLVNILKHLFSFLRSWIFSVCLPFGFTDSMHLSWYWLQKFNAKPIDSCYPGTIWACPTKPLVMSWNVWFSQSPSAPSNVQWGWGQVTVEGSPVQSSQDPMALFGLQVVLTK